MLFWKLKPRGARRIDWVCFRECVGAIAGVIGKTDAEILARLVEVEHSFLPERVGRRLLGRPSFDKVHSRTEGQTDGVSSTFQSFSRVYLDNK